MDPNKETDINTRAANLSLSLTINTSENTQPKMDTTVSLKRQRERDLAAEKRKCLANVNTKNIYTNGLASIIAVKINNKEETTQIERKNNNQKKTQEIISWVIAVNTALGLFKQTKPDK